MKSAMSFLIAACLVLGVAAQVRADALTLNTPGVVGIINDSGEQKNEYLYAQKLIDMDAGLYLYGPFYGVYNYETSLTEYSGFVIADNDEQVEWADNGIDGTMTVDLGWEFALAKYDGKNAGYVLFYLPTFGSVLPKTGWSIWGTQNQYVMSHYTPFNYYPPDQIPDGGSMVMLLGLGLMGLAGVRRLVK